MRYVDFHPPGASSPRTARALAFLYDHDQDFVWKAQEGVGCIIQGSHTSSGAPDRASEAIQDIGKGYFASSQHVFHALDFVDDNVASFSCGRSSMSQQQGSVSMRESKSALPELYFLPTVFRWT